MADYQLRTRINEELTEKIHAEVELLNELFPGVEANTSTVVRMALTDYLNRQNRKGVISLEIEHEALEVEDLKVTVQALDSLPAAVKNGEAQKAINALRNACLSKELQVLLKLERTAENNEKIRELLLQQANLTL